MSKQQSGTASLVTAVAHLREGVQVIGYDWTYLYLNETAAKHSKKAVVDLIGRTMMTCYPGIESTPVFDMLRGVMQRREPATLRHEFVYSSGERAWFDLFVDPVPEGICVLSIDVTGQKEAEAHSRVQSAALEAAANAIAITDRAGVIEWVNHAFSNLTGYTAAEAVGKNPRELVKSGHHDGAFYRNLWKTILSGQVWRGEMINRRKDGSLYTEDQAITPVRDSEGEITHFIAVKQDVTERLRADLEFRQRAELSVLGAAVGLSLAGTQAIGESLQQCADALVTHLGAAFARIWTLDERHEVLELQASAGLYTHLNGPHGRIPVGQYKIGRIARDRTPHLTNSVMADPEINDQEWAQRERIVAFAGHPLIANGKVVGVMALFARHPLSATVISALASVADHIALGIERHRAGEALRKAEGRMRFALEAAGVGIWEMDFTTDVLEWSTVLELQYGLPAHTFARTFDAFVEAVHPDDRDSLIETIRTHKPGQDFTVQHRALWPDGTVRWISGTGRIVAGEDGSAVRAVGVSIDVTERRLLEQQYQQSQKMEAVGRLAGGVAHDFNNLLTAILGYCELLLDDVGAGDPRRADLREIQKAGTSAAALTRQLLAFSRKQIIEPTVLDLNVIVSEMRPMLGRLIGEDVLVEMSLPPGLDHVKLDRGQVEQIILNLVVNARDAMPKGGVLTIQTANLELEETYARTHLSVRPGHYVALIVSDTGTGMTPEVQARLFEPFFTTKEPGKGTGLGLATVHGIVAQSGGSVQVYSEPGHGTAFKVFFPRVEAGEIAVDSVDSPSAPSRPTGTQVVLIVDDAEGLRDLARRLLQRQGYRVLVAANADEALAICERNGSVDVLLTDVVMPGASGPELTAQLLSLRPDLRVLYMSGYTEDAIVHHGVLKPGVAFIHKPFSSETLSRKVREVLQGAASPRSGV